MGRQVHGHLVRILDIILSSLRNSGKVAVVASEEDDAPIWLTDDGPFVVVVDPLDGSRNIDASIPTGTITKGGKGIHQFTSEWFESR
ncbi:hypothetical protein Droror1_Dr00013627 [Drosera rotundifolia]